jgi:hypothetical protein
MSTDNENGRYRRVLENTNLTSDERILLIKEKERRRGRKRNRVLYKGALSFKKNLKGCEKKPLDIGEWKRTHVYLFSHFERNPGKLKRGTNEKERTVCRKEE